MTRIAAIPSDRTSATAPSSTATGPFRARVGGYVVDMVIFGAVAMVFLVIAGLQLLLATEGAEQDASDAQFYTFLAIFGLGTPIAWTLMNLALLRMRGQTGGQYVAGLQLARADQRPPTTGNVLAWWFCLNPLLFSWPMGVVASGPLAALAAIVLDWKNVFLFGFVVLLCVAAPIVAFVSALVDGENRALHDRIAGTTVRPAR